MSVKSDKIESAPTGVRWHDLRPMTRADAIRELALPVPWLVLSWALYASPLWYAGPPASFVFFLCALRLNHEAIHGNLGLPRRGDVTVMHVLSFLMGASNNAVAHGHMTHHRHAMGPGDFEGRAGHMGFLEVLRYGPRFTLDVNRHAWAAANPAGRRWIVADRGLNAVLLALALSTGARILLYHVAAIALAQCLTAFFAVWITHHGALEAGLAVRSQRGLLARIAYLMFYHREHHLFPKVPIHLLPELARRLDEGVPGYAGRRIPVVPFLDRETIHA